MLAEREQETACRLCVLRDNCPHYDTDAHRARMLALEAQCRAETEQRRHIRWRNVWPGVLECCLIPWRLFADYCRDIVRGERDSAWLLVGSVAAITFAACWPLGWYARATWAVVFAVVGAAWRYGHVRS